MMKRMIRLGIVLLVSGVFSAHAQTIGEKYVQKVIIRFFAQRFQTADSTLKIDFKRLPDLSRFNGKTYRLDCYSQSRRLKLGFQTVWLNVQRQGKVVVKLPVAVNVQIKRKVVRATTNIPYRSPISEKMLKVEKRWISDTEILEQGLTDVHQAAGLETTHFIPSGKFLLCRDVEQPNVIRPGDQVEIWVPAGNLVVTTKGIARSAGKIGQYIYVKETTTGKRIKARVESQNVVIVANERSL